jgi:hypothetical protein
MKDIPKMFFRYLWAERAKALLPAIDCEGNFQQSREVPRVTGVRAGQRKRHFFGGIRWVRSGGGWFDMVTLLSALDGVMMLPCGRVWETHVIVMEDGD